MPRAPPSRYVLYQRRAVGPSQRLAPHTMGFWDFLLWIFWVFVFVAYLMVVFSIIADIFRDHALNGWLKAIWILYLIARGPGMAKRGMAQAQEMREQQDAYIRATAGSSGGAADDIAKAKSLLDAGTISQTEFDALKAKALSA